ncbi:helix-turn-helix domain-containing protein [Streptococcus merionis]|uniref:helix-turn-helix domain-containing protein n=1 Tax=Streptococcus merionis TaxID=400065 RepID=UPI003514C532
MDLYEYVGEQIRHQRKMAGMTQGELAELLDTKQQTIGMVENGKRRATIADLVKLRKIFNATADDFLPKDLN